MHVRPARVLSRVLTFAVAISVVATALAIPAVRVDAQVPGTPVNTVAPVIQEDDSTSGVRVPRLWVEVGQWNQTQAPTSFTYQWLRCNSAQNCVPSESIDGEWSNCYPKVPGDGAATFKVRVTAHNAAGTTSALSAAFHPSATAAEPTPQWSSTAMIEEMSVLDDETPNPSKSFKTSISGDGRFVETAQFADSTLRDRAKGTTSYLGEDQAGTSNFSSDGRYQAVTYYGSPKYDAYVSDLRCGDTRMVSRNPKGGGDVTWRQGEIASVSWDGRFVAFQSDAPGLTDIAVPAGIRQIYVYDRKEGTLDLASANLGVPGNADSTGASITSVHTPDVTSDTDSLDEAHYVVTFRSFATNLPWHYYGGGRHATEITPGPSGDIYLRAGGTYATGGVDPIDPSTGTKVMLDTTQAVQHISDWVTRVPSTTPLFRQADDLESAAPISKDGKFVSFSIDGEWPLPDDPPLPHGGGGYYDPNPMAHHGSGTRGFVVDVSTSTHTTTAINLGPTDATASVAYATIAGDGRFVAFKNVDSSQAFVSTDNNQRCDVYLWDRQTKASWRISKSSTGGQLPEGGCDSSFGMDLSDDASTVMFNAAASVLPGGDSLERSFAYNRAWDPQAVRDDLPPPGDGPLNVTVYRIDELRRVPLPVTTEVTVNGQRVNASTSAYQTPLPNGWLPVPVVNGPAPAITTPTSTVTIRVFDDHGEEIDVSPSPARKGAEIQLARDTMSWTGDTTTTSSSGESDGDNAVDGRVYFNFTRGPTVADVDGDSDGDGLLDSWEVAGYDEDPTQPGIELPFNTWGADPRKPDIFVELDHMSGWHPARNSLDDVVAAFSAHGYNLHVDGGPDWPVGPNTSVLWGAMSRADEVPYSKTLGFDSYENYQWHDFDQLRASHLGDDRLRVFHYGILGDAMPGDSTGISRGIPASDFLISAGLNSDKMPAVFMHELGHNLGLHHGGNEDENYKPNYLSIMNYIYSFGLPTTDGTVLNYSEKALPQLDESSLDESAGLVRGDQSVRDYLARTKLQTRRLCAKIPYVSLTDVKPEQKDNASVEAIDWNCNDTPNEVGVSYDINHDGKWWSTDTLSGAEDWTRLEFSGGKVGDHRDREGLSASTPPEPPNPLDPLDAPRPVGFGVIGQQHGTAAPGTTVVLPYVVTNTGTDSLTLSVAAVAPAGWSPPTPSATSLTLSPGESRVTQLTTILPTNAPQGSVNIVGLTLTPIGTAAAKQTTTAITVSSAGSVPTAVNDSATTAFATPVTFSPLANDTDPGNDLDPASIQVTQAWAGSGTFTKLADNRITYTPQSGSYGTDAAIYEVCDTGGRCDSAAITVTVNAPACTITGTEGADVLTGTTGADVICGLGGDDSIDGGSGNDTIVGGQGADDIKGGAGADKLYGGIGPDTIDAGNGNDAIVEGGIGTDTLLGGAGTDTLRGGDGDDTLDGGAARDLLYGENGDDHISGRADNDDLFGGDGDDLLQGGIGTDLLDGGTGTNELIDGPNGQVKGTVTDAQGVPLSGIRVDVLQGTTTVASGTTNASGKYTVVGVPPASYTIRFFDPTGAHRTTWSDGKVSSVGATSKAVVEGEYIAVTASLPNAVKQWDFDGNGTTDRGVYRPSSGGWYIKGFATEYFGLSGDIPVPADYNTDGITDKAVYRNGSWLIQGQTTVSLGNSTDIPVPADYNGDGIIDIAVYRPSNGGWYVKGKTTLFFGTSTDIPVPADYNGDGLIDRAVYRPSDGSWLVKDQTTRYFGTSTDVPLPADYNGDGTIDLAVYRPSNSAWLVQGQTTIYYGATGDIPVPADFNNDGLVDRAIFRRSNGGWYVQGQTTVYLGTSTDRPLLLSQAQYLKATS